MLEKFRNTLEKEPIDRLEIASLKKQIELLDVPNKREIFLKLTLLEFRNSIPQIETKQHEKPDSKETVLTIAYPLFQYLEQYPNNRDNWQIHWRLAQFFLEYNLHQESFFHLQETIKQAPERHHPELLKAIFTLQNSRFR